MPQPLLYATDWIPWASRGGESPRGDEQELGALVLAASTLEQLAALERPSAALQDSLREAMRELPPQWHFLSDNAFSQWLRIASLAEHRGALRLAGLMLRALEHLLLADSPLSTSTAIVVGPPNAPSEALALCLTRRGRIARVNGRLEDAKVWYRAALRRAPVTHWQDARPQAYLGLVAVALGRGNIPEAERRLRALLARRASLPPLYLVPAHQLMAVAKRKRGLWLDALLHVWSAFDQLDGTDQRREQLICTMSEIAYEAGDKEAAFAGFQTVAASNVAPLVRIPGIYGAARVLGQLPHSKYRVEALAARYMADIVEWTSRTTAPADLLLLYMARAELCFASGDAVGALEAVDTAADIADSTGLYERQFMVAALRDRFASRAPSPALETTRAPGIDDPRPLISSSEAPREARRTNRHPLLERLLALH